MITIRLGDLHPQLEPHPKQREILLSPARFKIVAAGRRFGKGHMALQEAVSIVLRKPPRSEIWIVSPSHVQQEAMWLKACNVLGQAKHDIFVRKGNPRGLLVKDVYSTRGYRRLLLFNDSIIYFKSGHDPESLRGAGDQLIYVILDEAAYLTREAWDIVSFALMDRKASATFISTPNNYNPRNWFYDRWVWGQDYIYSECTTCDGSGCEACQGTGVIAVPNPDKKPSYKSWQFSSFDNPYVSPDEINRIIEEENFTYADIQREIYAQFVETEGAIFTLQMIQDCERGEFSPPQKGVQYAMGVDFGQVRDFTVCAIINLETGHLDALERFQGSWNLQFERISSIYHDYNEPYTLADATQLGGSVIEQELRKRGVTNLVGVKFNGPNKQRLIESLRVAIERQALTFPTHKQLRIELLSYEAKRLASGHLRYAGPKSGFDDIVDALALAWEAYRIKSRSAKSGIVLTILGGRD